jgi:hypothetical protein
MILHREGEVGAAHAAALLFERFEGVRTSSMT